MQWMARKLLDDWAGYKRPQPRMLEPIAPKERRNYSFVKPYCDIWRKTDERPKSTVNLDLRETADTVSPQEKMKYV